MGIDTLPGVRRNVPLAPYTTFGVAGAAEYFLEVASSEQLVEAVRSASVHKIPYRLIAGGSNIVCPDVLPGLTIHVVSSRIAEEAPHRLVVDAGVSLAGLISFSLEHGRAGLEALSGIPGSVGGAIVGNAGAYGQTISGPLVRVEIFDGETVRWMSKEECHFVYRDSAFKAHPWIVLRAEFVLVPGDAAALRAKSEEIIALRAKKYPPGIKCPGSFFKNVFFEALPKKTQSMVPQNRDFYGKVPAWFFLNEVGARGMRWGGLRIADIHGNLIVNEGGATYADVVSLAAHLKELVRNTFGIELEEEVRYIT